MRHWLHDLVFRGRAVFDRGTADRELNEELQFHRAMDIESLRERGLSASQAEWEAGRHFGTLALEAERAREGWGVSLLEELIADARHALRQLQRRPGISAIVLVALGLGIGASVSLVSVVDSLMLRRLPYANASRVHAFWMDDKWSGEEYDFLRSRLGVFDEIADFSTDAAPYAPNTAATGATVLPFVLSAPTLFDVLGVHPALGRTFDANDDRAGAPPVIVISDPVWRQDFGGAPSVIGHQIALDGELVTVIGVMPRGFFFPTPEIRAWRPLRLDPASSMYKVGYLTLVARSKAGVSSSLVNGEVQRIAKLLGTRFTYSDAADKTKGAHAIPIRTYLLGDVRTPLLLLLGAVALLLLIACANGAALILARTTDRAGEMAMRTSLGASAGRLARQILTESLVLALCAAIMGSILASAGLRLLVMRLPLQREFGSTVAIGWISFATAFALALIIALIVSIVPVRHLFRGSRELGVNRERSDEGVRHGVRRVHDAIIAAQVTLAVLLVVGATLLIRTVEQIRDIDPGFDARGVTTYNLVPPSGMPEPSKRQFFRDVLARVTTLPEVKYAGMTNRLPLRDLGYELTVKVEDRPDLAGAKRPNSLYRTATPGFLAAMGMRLAAGRGIDSTDAGGSPVVLVNESFARRMWPGHSAIGEHITEHWGPEPITRTVVGVVRETHMTGLTVESPFTMWIPLEQAPVQQGGVLVVRSAAPAAAVMPLIRREIAALNSQVAVSRVQTMDDVESTALAAPLRLRFFFILFAALALLLGAIGVYGTVSYAVARRRPELAVRMALGASPGIVLREVMVVGITPVAVGVGAGSLAALGASRLVSGILYGVRPTDLVSLSVAALALLLAGAAAAFLPALRAGHTNPVEALRGVVN
jgi:putative ABC transport system permease protein